MADIYYIASLKHTHRDHEHITFWGVAHRGYTPVVGERCGQYTLDEAIELNDGVSYIAVPVAAVQAILSPEPYFKLQGKDCKFYDQVGPVVLNSRGAWAILIEASLFHDRRARKVRKPEVFTRKRRSFALSGPTGSV
jgi:hypothetical protein